VGDMGRPIKSNKVGDDNHHNYVNIMYDDDGDDDDDDDDDNFDILLKPYKKPE
jgi:hypothetical protein